VTLKEINQQLNRCTKCSLREGASQPVPGIGFPGSKYMIIGEAPGREEDEMGVPFVGMSGKRLNQLLELSRIDLNECYITNTIKCHPPSNRDPHKAELKSCVQWLMNEIALVKPKIIITLGRIPLGLFSPYGVRQMHGTQFDYEFDELGLKVNIIAQYHPAAAFHQPTLWAVILDDWEHLPVKVDCDFTVISLSTLEEYVNGLS